MGSEGRAREKDPGTTSSGSESQFFHTPEVHGQVHGSREFSTEYPVGRCARNLLEIDKGNEKLREFPLTSATLNIMYSDEYQLAFYHRQSHIRATSCLDEQHPGQPGPKGLAKKNLHQTCMRTIKHATGTKQCRTFLIGTLFLGSSWNSNRKN